MKLRKPNQSIRPDFNKLCPNPAFTTRQYVCPPQTHVVLLLLLIDAISRAVTAGGALVFEWEDLNLLVFWERAVEMLLEDGFGFDSLELGLEVFGAFGVGGRVGATTRVGHMDVTDISDLVSWMAPSTYR